MRVEPVDWKPRLEVRVETQVESVQLAHGTSFAEAGAARHVDDVMASGVERSHLELIAQHVEVAGSKVKQRADAGISLAVAVTQVTLKVPHQPGDAPVEEALPAIREPAIKFNLERLIATNGIRETICLSVWTYKRVATDGVNARLSKTNGCRVSRLKEVVGLSPNTHHAARRAGASGRSIRDETGTVERRREDERHEIPESVQLLADVDDGIHLINGEVGAIRIIARQGRLRREDGRI